MRASYCCDQTGEIIMEVCVGVEFLACCCGVVLLFCWKVKCLSDSGVGLNSLERPS